MNRQRQYEISRVLSVLGLITLGAAAGSGCTKDPVVDQRVVTLYTLEDPPNAITPSSCAVPSDSFALYTAAGDFQPDIDSPPQSSVRLNELSPQLSAIPSSTRQLTLAVGPTTNPWRGYELIPATGDIAVLLWPAGHECELKPSVDARPGSTITPYDDRHVLIAGGVNSSSFIADLSNGSVAQLGLSQEITTPRAFASATKFSGGVVIAGGDYGNAPTSDAEIFSSQSSSFTGESINLGVPRALQGATLLTNGNILLVGGETNATTLYPSLELIDPVLKRATQAGLPQLDSPRANPTVLTLTSGEVLVAGGVDASGSAVRSVEWFSKDASANIGQASIAASHHQAFVALPAGGALGVVSSDTTGVTTTWVITSDHQIQQGASLATVLPGSNIRLFPGANGAPLLWTGSNWFRWSPWTGAFVPFSDATSNGTTLANGPSEAAVTASPDPGLALWLENAQGVTAGKVLGLRFDSRGEYSTDVETLLSGDTTSIAPDRLPGSDLSFQEAIANGPATGLALGPNAQAVIADANYLNFSLDFDSGELEMPTLILRNATENDFTIGEDSAVTCGLPLNANHVHVERNGSVVSVSTDASALAACGIAIANDARLSILFRGPSAGSTFQARVRNVVVKREN